MSWLKTFSAYKDKKQMGEISANMLSDKNKIYSRIHLSRVKLNGAYILKKLPAQTIVKIISVSDSNMEQQTELYFTLLF